METYLYSKVIIKNTMNIETNVETIQALINSYKLLPDINKIGKGKEITALIDTTQKQLVDYSKKLEVLDLQQEPTSDNHNASIQEPTSDIDNSSVQDTEITQEEFIELLEEITISEQLIRTTDDLENVMIIYETLSNNIIKCEKFLANKQMIIENI